MRSPDRLFRLEVLPVRRGAAGEDLRAGRGQVAHHGPLAGRRAQPPVEAREHVRRLHELFFTLAPDKAAIESNINRAMYLADKSLYGYYRDWNEKGFYNRLISGNVNQTVVVDSMRCDFDSYPYRVTTYARQMIIRGSNITERSLVTRCRLQSTVRSDNNPQGFLAEHFEILENRDLRTVER